MSYNIDHVEVLVLDASMRTDDLVRLRDDDNRPEGCFLDEMDPGDRADVMVALPNLWWYGERSGTSYDELIKIVLPATRGTIEAVMFWEGGDGVSGVRCVDGVVTECDVSYVLTPVGDK